ncbi:NUDIX domain-containing protein [Nocardia sp. NPDC048505]|uniref:NUDIX domain-containing protein n=1 Tax=unclassified Nocardia TaxID=2637762 RepID=UPI0033E0E1DD
METATAVVAGIVRGITPFDAVEQAHRDETLTWLASTDDIFRRRKPATPTPHLVSYIVPVDPDGRALLLGRHRLSGLWLPPGGHVEPAEHPRAAAEREAREELGRPADFTVLGPDPLFLTVNPIRDRLGGHVDISLWYLTRADRKADWQLDPREFDGGSWWDIDRFGLPESDPHLPRFIAKLDAGLAACP